MRRFDLGAQIALQALDLAFLGHLRMVTALALSSGDRARFAVQVAEAHEQLERGRRMIDIAPPG